ncbi:unnamed protein product [Rotaria sp. Silwood2]|nr:unnamed protein product [Rotaria sp. Silwood2]CAF4215838.1 unnamed protein product [Rotaria sp. Silwood2]
MVLLGLFRTGNMSNGRYSHTASVLTNWKVLVTGGWNNNSTTNSAELDDPITEAWIITSSMNSARFEHTASVLANGKVLVVGGQNGSSLNSAELYDPSTGTWTSTSNIHDA